MELNMLQGESWTEMQVLEQVLWSVAWAYGICCLVMLCAIAAAGLESILSLGESKPRKAAKEARTVEIRRPRSPATIPTPQELLKRAS